MKDLERRAKATKATQERFGGVPFDWRTRGTCIHLLRFHAEQMGHKVPTVPRFKSALSARKALVATGRQTLPALLDTMFPRIPPAFMLTGDVMALPGDSNFEGLVIRAGVQKWIGWHEEAEGCTIIDADMNAAIGAWRL